MELKEIQAVLYSSLGLNGLSLDPIIFWSVFLVSFVIIYNALRRSKFFDNNTINFVIALVIAFFTASSTMMASLIAAIYPYIGIMTVVFFTIYGLFSLFSKRVGKAVASFVLIGIIIYFINTGSITGLIKSKKSFKTSKNFFPYFTEEDAGAIIFLTVSILIIVMIYFLVTAPVGRESKESKLRKAVEVIAKIFRGGNDE